MSQFFGFNYYEVYTVYTAQNVPQLLLVVKNGGTVLYSSRYNYNADSNFFKAYVNATISSKVLTIPSI
jgi:hypothetical protein